VHSCPAKRELAVLEEIRATIRRCRHGMLVTTACMLGALACAAWPHGPIVSLQPCSVEHVPIGSARWIGPINDINDLLALRDWLEQGELDYRALPDPQRAESH
jgi:hypothetical protein